MSRQVTFAAIRIDASPAPTESRLERAEKLAAQAAVQGAEVAISPEVFNTGYGITAQDLHRTRRSVYISRSGCGWLSSSWSS